MPTHLPTELIAELTDPALALRIPAVPASAWLEAKERQGLPIEGDRLSLLEERRKASPDYQTTVVTFPRPRHRENRGVAAFLAARMLRTPPTGGDAA